MKNYNYETIRELVGAVFNDEDLHIFCHDNFSDVKELFTTGQTQKARIQLLIDYVERKGHTDRLLSKIRKKNDYQYNKFESRLTKNKSNDRSTEFGNREFIYGHELIEHYDTNEVTVLYHISSGKLQPYDLSLKAIDIDEINSIRPKLPPAMSGSDPPKRKRWFEPDIPVQQDTQESRPENYYIKHLCFKVEEIEACFQS